jgi:hypothetical protein
MDRETASLIGSDKVEGTAVYGPDEQKIGSIQRVMRVRRSADSECSVFLRRISIRQRGMQTDLTPGVATTGV